MNHIFKTVWNRVRRCYVAVNETVTGASQATGSTNSLVIGSVLTAIAFTQSFASEIHVQTGTYGDIGYYDKIALVGDSSKGGAIINGNVNGGEVFVTPFRDGGVSNVGAVVDGLYTIGYTRINGNLTADHLYLDYESLHDDHLAFIDHNAGITPDYSSNDYYNNWAEYLKVTGTTKLVNFTAAGRGSFGDLIVTQRFSNGFDKDFLPGNAPTNEVNTITATNLTANIIDNGSNIVVLNQANVSGKLTNRGNVTFGTQTSVAQIENLTGANFTANGDISINGQFHNQGNIYLHGQLSFRPDGSLNQTAGSVTTSINNVFSNPALVNEGLNYIGLNASNTETVKTSLSQFFTRYVPGQVAQALADHATFTGGKVIITGVNLTTTQRDDLTKAFKERFFNAKKPHSLKNVA